MLAAMFSATMANLSANFNLKSAILTKDIYQMLFRPLAGERELLVIGGVMTLLVGGETTVLAAVMAARGESIFAVMLSFNTLISFSYGPPALLGLLFRKAPWWSGMATFAAALILGILGDFLFHLDVHSAGRLRHTFCIRGVLLEYAARPAGIGRSCTSLQEARYPHRSL
jgi:Na+/proline symporter